MNDESKSIGMDIDDFEDCNDYFIQVKIILKNMSKDYVKGSWKQRVCDTLCKRVFDGLPPITYDIKYYNAICLEKHLTGQEDLSLDDVWTLLAFDVAANEGKPTFMKKLNFANMQKRSITNAFYSITNDALENPIIEDRFKFYTGAWSSEDGDTNFREIHFITIDPGYKNAKAVSNVEGLSNGGLLKKKVKKVVSDK